MSSRDDLPGVALTRSDVLALYDAAIEREDLSAADRWADLLLRLNDRTEEARS